MNNAKKELKLMSILILAFAALTIVMNCIKAFTGGLTITELPADAKNLGLTLEAYQIVAYITFALTLLFILPNVFVGLRGLKMSKEPAKTKGHIVWAFILGALALVSMFSHIPQAIGTPNFDNIWTVIDKAVEAFIFGTYIYYAILVYREA